MWREERSDGRVVEERGEGVEWAWSTVGEGGGEMDADSSHPGSEPRPRRHDEARQRGDSWMGTDAQQGKRGHGMESGPENTDHAL